jgi:DNA primase
MSTSIWQEIKDKLSVEEVISDYLNVKSKGSNYTCNCPFHREKTPSLIISPEKQVWHCFGCGVGGDIFAFVSLIENISKVEAMQKLADKAGIDHKLSFENNSYKKSRNSNSNIGSNDIDTVKEVNSNQSQDSLTKVSKNSKNEALELIQWVQTVYSNILLNTLKDRSHPVTQYCLERGLTQDLIKEFKIGLAPSHSILVKLLETYPEKLTLAKRLGLIQE